MVDPEATTREADAAPASYAPQAVVLGGRYTLQAVLGAGGMGTVYLARDAVLGEPVALKIVRPNGRADDLVIERLRAEVRLARRVTHPNVTRIYDIGEHGGVPFLTMEYVRGEALSARIAREGPFDLPAFFRVAMELTDGLVAAHAVGVLHRDLKPQNVLLADGVAKIADFGGAFSRGETSADLIVGTPAYMAPEQTEAVFDERTDVFGLGTILFTMLTGQKPFKTAPADRPARPPNPRDARPTLPVALGEVVASCLEPSPARRPPSVAELKQALIRVESALEEHEQEARSKTSPADRVLSALVAAPRYVRLKVTSASEDAQLASALKQQLAEHLSKLSSVCVLDSDGGPRIEEAEAEVSLRRDGEGVVVDLQVVGRREGFTIRRESLRGREDALIALAQLAASSLRDALVLAPQGDALPPLEKSAEEAYLRGRAELRKSWVESTTRAVAAFERALAAAPGHPLVIAGLASARARLAFFVEGSVAAAREAGELAVRLVPRSAEAHLARASVHLLEMEVESATARLLSALDVAPGNVEGLTSLAAVLLDVGAPSDAMRLCEAAVARDPDRPDALLTMSRGHALLGQWDASARALARLTPRWAESFGPLTSSRFAVWRGEREAALRAIDVHASPTKSILLATRRQVLAAGEPPRRDEEFARRIASPASPPRTRAFYLQLGAEMEAYLGDFEQAIASVEQAAKDGLYDSFWLERCPLFDPMRGMPRFEKVREIVSKRAHRVLGWWRPA